MKRGNCLVLPTKSLLGWGEAPRPSSMDTQQQPGNFGTKLLIKINNNKVGKRSLLMSNNNLGLADRRSAERTILGRSLRLTNIFLDTTTSCGKILVEE